MNDTPSEREQRARDLAAFANAGGQPNQPTPGGHALVRPTSGIAERVIGAQPVAVYRDEQKVLQKLAALAAAAGSDWFYRFPVRGRDGVQSWIEGPSIKLANDVCRIFGNNAVEIREIDVGDAWTFYARFTDVETGFSMERAYRQRKSQSALRTRDPDRQLDIAYQIGQSKAIRNVITNALQIYCDYAFECAQNSLVEKIGKDLATWRERTVAGLARIPVEVARVERVIGRTTKDWLAPDVAKVIAMAKSIIDGMAALDDMFPPIEAAPAPAPAAPPASPSTTTGSESPGAPSKAPSGVPRDSSGGEAESADVSKPAAAATAAPAAAINTENPIAVAYARGQTAKAQGVARRALPGEYRDAARAREALAWQAGYDGAPVPTFSGSAGKEEKS
jgi:hypothetical protein